MPETNYFWDPLSDSILQERDESGAVTAEYTTEPGLYGNVVSQNRAGADSQFHFDAQGSTLAVSDDGQNVADTRAYSAFGQITESTGGTTLPMQYIGRKAYYRDSLTSHYSVRSRTYDAARARWLTVDPLSRESLSCTPPLCYLTAPNSYLVFRNNPLTYNDPSGLEPIEGNDTDRCSCEDFVTSLGGPITITPDRTITASPRFSVCAVDVECKDDCDGFPGKAYEPNNAGFIRLCLSNKGRHRSTLTRIYEHELEHARQLCGGAELRSCSGCINWETKAHKVSCQLAFPGDAALQANCVRCGVYLSCKDKCKGKPNAPKKPSKGCNSWTDIGVILPDFPFPEL